MPEDKIAEVPANIKEFNTIAGLIFAQLYRAFPVHQDIDDSGIFRSMGVAGDYWNSHLPSGRKFKDVLEETIFWLHAEGYTRPVGPAPPGFVPRQNYKAVVLTQKGLSAMNAVPAGLKEPLGTELSKADQASPKNLANMATL